MCRGHMFKQQEFEIIKQLFLLSPYIIRHLSCVGMNI